ncbi:hypothetical protein COCSUDRAFT_32902 [Coccomyxa subellipsoidea C-169]|uniref:Uncharacterized protein n=1 Tax=Coccomyxa subellipsoidea (strain C-169) TaxID=574566 RepID=I0YZT3_COCSC|nr:hypothetical protein COCSUDRAFT_32902 [Coccomyxa subellipsoidea C-169]EIE23902.1 hypothetical protein COCSUDRAFT_32902 [Coccomyxa subellipsoidea C-169]|eukprot:XP_005648446.1 hypothetical protein COCSUDRAFT_32902 [Coccomyxa subellipsoidea C-169]
MAPLPSKLLSLPDVLASLVSSEGLLCTSASGRPEDEGAAGGGLRCCICPCCEPHVLLLRECPCPDVNVP